MGRTAVVVATVTLVLVALAPAASAQRDPFEPVIDTTLSGQGSGNGGVSGNEATQPAPPSSEAVPSTGVPTDRWLAIAYALIALGGGALALRRVLVESR